MFLSSGLLTDDERRRAFDAVPDVPALLRNRAVADAFAQPVFLGQLDGMIGGFAREASSPTCLCGCPTTWTPASGGEGVGAAAATSASLWCAGRSRLSLAVNLRVGEVPPRHYAVLMGKQRRNLCNFQLPSGRNAPPCRGRSWPTWWAFGHLAKYIRK